MEDNQFKAIDAIRDWSKWLIGINFAATTGCVVVLQEGVKGPPRPFLLLAIAAFTISVFCSILLVRALAKTVEHVPFKNKEGDLISIYKYPAFKFLSINTLSALQLIFFMMGIVCFLSWVALKPEPKDTPPPGAVILTQEAPVSMC